MLRLVTHRCWVCIIVVVCCHVCLSGMKRLPIAKCCSRLYHGSMAELYGEECSKASAWLLLVTCGVSA
jgi:hypothetical protein